MMAFIFLLLFITVAAIWRGSRSLALSFFALSLILAISWFIHHMTTTIGLSL